jgi:hypothetical protein
LILLHSLKCANQDKKIYTGETKEINGIKITTVANTTGAGGTDLTG